MTNATITIERLPEETPKAYQARVEYITAGRDRSLDKLRQKYARNTSYKRQLQVWSSRYDWVECARKYDEAAAHLVTQEALEQYRADLEAHRKKASEAGQALYQVAGQLLKKVNAALATPRQIEGKDGRMYTLHGIDFNSSALGSALSTVTRSFQTALDLEAHALGVDKLLPSLETDDSE